MNNKEKDWFTNKPINNKIKNKKTKQKFSFSKLNPNNVDWKEKGKSLLKVTTKVGRIIAKPLKVFQPPVQEKRKRWYSKSYGFIYDQIANGVFKLGQGVSFLYRKVRDRELLRKIFYTLLLILVFRIAATITIPGIYIQKNLAQDSGSLIGVLDMMGGGALRQFSIVALGITPYITSSIIMQMLQSEVFPPLYRLSRSGPQGKRKINIITRIVTFFFAYLQAITIIQQVTGNGFVTFASGLNTFVFKFFGLPSILIAGSMFALFLGEQITEKGVGNGTSLIIFSGIAAGLPAKFRNAYLEIAGGQDASGTFIGVVNFILYLLVFVLLIYVIGYLYKAERHVPTQQTGSGLTTDVKQMSKLPIKLNPAGVMPVIFALTIATIPLTVASFMNHQNLTKQWIEANMKLTDPIGLGILIVIIFLFTIVMALVIFAPFKVADQFKKNGTFIPGIRPGDETEEYLTGVVTRLSIFSAIYLSVVSSIAYIEQIIGLSRAITFSGTSLIIMVSVAIETLSQLKARERSTRISRAKIKTISSSKSDKAEEKVKGLLW